MELLEDFLNEIKKRGISAVARKSNVPLRTVQSWVYGQCVPSLVLAQKVADAMDMEFLLFDKE